MSVVPFPIAARRTNEPLAPLPPANAMMSEMASDHLREVLDGKVEGLAVVSISALLVALDRLDHLEGRS